MKPKHLLILGLTVLILFNASILFSRFSSKSPSSSASRQRHYELQTNEHPSLDVPSIFVEKMEGLEDEDQLREQINQNNAQTTPGIIGGDESSARKEKIREAFIHAFQNGYMKHAFPRDELLPISGGGYSPWISSHTQGMALSAIDALDTMWIMGYRKLFKDTVRRVVHHWETQSWPNGKISLFETVIRIIGGLVSAYELSHEKPLLDLAQKVADRIMPAFSNQPPYNLPSCQINLLTQHHSCPHWTENTLILSEFSTIQVELIRLSELTQNSQYKVAADRVTEFLRANPPRADGLYYVQLDTRSPVWRSKHVTLGMWGDSTYEYFLKQWILTGGKDESHWDMYEKALNGIIDKLVVKSNKSGLVYIQEIRGDMPVNKMEHLVCFAGGMFALGAFQRKRLRGTYENYNRDMQLAKDFTKTCYETYKRMPSGLGPETTKWNVDSTNDFIVGINKYVLRPETVESLFYLWKITGEPMYKDWMWGIFEAIEKHCKTPAGYCSVKNVDTHEPEKVDQMHSYFLAETLKYMYLTFEEADVLPLTEWVFNTEAHPLRIQVDPK